MSTLAELTRNYVEARGLDDIFEGEPSARKVLEEAGELIEALALYWQGSLSTHDTLGMGSIRQEVADVALALGICAERMGLSVEECVEEKTELDRGRGW